MYLLEHVIETLGFRGSPCKWTSEDHRTVAMKVILGNPHIDTCENLCRVVEAINGLTDEQVHTYTAGDLANMLRLPILGVYPNES